MGAGNETAVAEFILEGFSGLNQSLQLLLSLIFPLVHLTIVIGNTTIIFLVHVDHHLQTPMYFFISNLAFLEICFTSSTTINLLVILSSGRRTISVSSCFAQSYFCFALDCIELAFLVVMSFDCYVAICQPLHYAAIMKRQLCTHLVLAEWVIGYTHFSYHLVLISKLTFCGSNKIHHFFSDNSSLLKLSSSDVSLLRKADSILMSSVVLSSLCVFHCILHMPSASGRKKAFATCSFHLTSLAIVYRSCIFLYAWPSEDVPVEINRILALLNTILYPFVNPFIYSLRNKAVKLALKEVIGHARVFFFSPVIMLFMIAILIMHD